jgi:NAD(P)-dependent dehydrogenase (short-subunit alcohol dehydrogenase family)
VMQPGSSIVNISSILGLTTAGLPQAAYSASKAAVIGLTRDLAQQWSSRKGIRVNAIAPAFFPTEMTTALFDNDEGTEWVSRLTPMGRGGELSELCGALVYLAGPSSSYTTGAVIPVDGGWTAV